MARAMHEKARAFVDTLWVGTAEMENTSFVALSRVATLRRQLSIIANNVANMNTTGFKSEHMMFMEHPVRSRGGQRIMGDKVSYCGTSRRCATSGGSFRETATRWTWPFTATATSSSRRTGQRYTRNGRFQLDEAGQLVTQEGDAVLSDGGQPFLFAPGDSDIHRGRATAPFRRATARWAAFGSSPSTTPRIEGSLRRPVRRRDGARRCRGTRCRAEHAGKFELQPIIEMTRLIDVNRNYKQANKLIEAEDERMKR